MSNEHEQGYIEGRRRTLLNLLQHVLGELRGFPHDQDAPVFSAAAREKERQEIIAVLRRVCAEHGDNDWRDSLHLGDVIESHLAVYLDVQDDEEPPHAELRRLIEHFRALQAKERPHGAAWMAWRDAADEAESFLKTL